MPRPATATLYRIAAAAGLGSAAVLLVNAAKRAEIIPTSAVTQLVAPLAQILALALVTALYLGFGRSTGRLGLVAFLLNWLALSALIGVEFVINLVFRYLPSETVQALRAAPLGIALTAASVLFLLGSLGFVAPRSPLRRSSCMPSARRRSRCVRSSPSSCWTSGSRSWPWESRGWPSGSSTAPTAPTPGR